jgi:uncharacterized protein
MRRVLVVLFMLSMMGGAVPSRADGPVTRWGYMETSDGAKLRYTLHLPSDVGRFPVALIFSVYTDGVGALDYPTAESAYIANALFSRGYAILGVSMRGTGCSGGQWDLFQPASDGYDVVEWAAAAEWSSGDVGMFGYSAPGISQLLTAATHPPHLRAITPADVSTDFYRDVAYPGGIGNATFTGFWTLAARPVSEYQSIAYAAQQGDPDCAPTIASKPVPSDYMDFFTLYQHKFDDKAWDRYSPEPILAQIDVPILTCQAMQDDQVSSHATGWLDMVNPDLAWTVFTNGHHGTCDDYSTPFTTQLVDFFDRYVRGIDNAFEEQPHVQVWHETTANDDGDVATPNWVENFQHWPVSVAEQTLYLGADGALGADAAVEEAIDTYAYPLAASSMEANEYAHESTAWAVPSAPGGALTYTTAPLTDDLEVFGPGSLDVWFSSTAADTDVQVTVTDVRGDGQEVYVQRGWLRASHRRLDIARSTTVRPYHTHLSQDAALLTPMEPVQMRIEINPMSYTFRAGSKLRITIEAPTGATGLFGFDHILTPALNSVLHGTGHPSRLVLGVVDGARAMRSAPPCGSVLSQPCRPAM